MVCGGLWWFAVVCGGLWWIAVVCLLVIPVPHARAPGFCDRVTVIRPNPFIGYQSQRGRWLSRDMPLLYILSVFSYNVR